MSTGKAWPTFVALALCAAPAAAQHELRFVTTTEGEITLTGNTLGLSHLNGTNGPGAADSIGTFIAADPTSVDDTPVNSGNPWFAGTTERWQDNGSTALLQLPFDKDYEILYAELLWGGGWNFGAEDVDASLNVAVTLRHENGAVLSVTPDPETAVRMDIDSPNIAVPVRYYIRSADVTDFVAEHGGGEYTVEGVPATQDHAINTLNAAGWTLAVAYGGSQIQARNMGIWVGAQWVDENDEVDFTLDGFCTPPTGPVTGQALISAMEGDANRTDDQVLIAETSAGPFVALSAENNPETNFFGAQINDVTGALDDSGSFGTRNHTTGTPGTHTAGGRQGWDLTGVQLDGDHLDNDQQTATLRATSTGDSYVATLVAMSVDVNAPQFDTTNAITVEPAQVGIGDTVVYTVTLENQGTAAAEDVVFYMPLADGLTLLGFELDGVAGDVDGDAVTAADLTTGVALGTIDFDDTAVVEIQARVDAAPVPPADAVFSARPRWSYEYESCAGQPVIATEVLADGAAVLEVTRLELRLSSVPAVLTRRGSATLEVRVVNSGAVDASGVTLGVGVPAGLDYVAGSTELNGIALTDDGGMPYGNPSDVSSSGAPASVVEAAATATVAFEVTVPDEAPASTPFEATLDPDGAGPAVPITELLTLSITGPGDPVCGDGAIDGAEVCDDGNLTDDDGCSGCAVDPGFTCSGEPSDCNPIAQPDTGGTPDAGPDAPAEIGPDLTGGDDATEDEQDGSQRTVTSEGCGCAAGQSDGDPVGVAGILLALIWVRRRAAGSG